MVVRQKPRLARGEVGALVERLSHGDGVGGTVTIQSSGDVSEECAFEITVTEEETTVEMSGDCEGVDVTVNGEDIVPDAPDEDDTEEAEDEEEAEEEEADDAEEGDDEEADDEDGEEQDEEEQDEEGEPEEEATEDPALEAFLYAVERAREATEEPAGP